MIVKSRDVPLPSIVAPPPKIDVVFVIVSSFGMVMCVIFASKLIMLSVVSRAFTEFTAHAREPLPEGSLFETMNVCASDSLQVSRQIKSRAEINILRRAVAYLRNEFMRKCDTSI